MLLCCLESRSHNERYPANRKSIMAANPPLFWANLCYVYQGVHSASWLAYDVRTPWERGWVFCLKANLDPKVRSKKSSEEGIKECSMFYIAGVKSIQTLVNLMDWHSNSLMCKVRTTGPCLRKHNFLQTSSTIMFFYGHNRQILPLWGQFLELKIRAVRIC